MTDFAAIETAYKNADWAEVLCLLDEHFGNTPTPQYSTLKINIEGYLIQALMPPNAAIQGLRLLINQLKKNDETTTPDEKHQAQQRGNDMSAQKYKDFYHYLLKFPYHSHHETIHNYFCSCQLKNKCFA
ncbi:MAG: hypothetical protein IPN94_09180 [Sphingobacteriales bacterium]|nr:hypothetical protein [Sphingobacteriales bacterium]